MQHSFDLTDHGKFALFLGGLFAYDLVANFEPLGEAPADNQCPDYVFYVAETLMVIDHQRETCQLQATQFQPGDALHSQLKSRMREIRAQVNQNCLCRVRNLYLMWK